MVRWPGKVPAGVVTEEMLSAHDWYATFAALAGASDTVPTDRPMDGVDASKFLLGESEHTGRDTILFFGPDGSLMSVKWHNVKVTLRYSEGDDKPIVSRSSRWSTTSAATRRKTTTSSTARWTWAGMFGICMKYVGEWRRAWPSTRTSSRGRSSTGTRPTQDPTPRRRSSMGTTTCAVPRGHR